MSYVAIAFPVSVGDLKERKAESLKRAQKFAESSGLDNGPILLRPSVYGCVVPDSVSDDILQEASKNEGKVLPFVEKEKAKVVEGSWIELKESTPGTRFDMVGTVASNPVDGKLLPGKYFVLGLQESEGGVYATLGRVDKLEHIGQKGKPGQFAYSVDINKLRESMKATATAKAIAPVAAAEAKTESAKHTRTDAILDYLLENDPYALAEDRKEKAKLGKADTAAEYVGKDEMLSLIEHAMKEEGKVLTESKPAAPAPTPVVAASAPASHDDNAILEGLLQATGQSSAPDDVVGDVDELLEAQAAPEASTIDTAYAAVDTETEEEATELADDSELEEAMDPEVFADIRAIITLLKEDGVDVDGLSDEELQEAVSELLNISDEDEVEDKDPVDEPKEEAKADEEVSDDSKENFADDGFEEGK